ncbi:MAG TPA: hypothetical protein H9799_08555 [Candidatus Mediterraneibacter merdipullorum]|nr:hypothetical protein [Candidatus Mediterraneibacter merdipullorum]
MIFRKEIYFTRDMDEFYRAKNALDDAHIRYTWKSNPMTNPGRQHGVPFIDASAAYEYHLYVASKEKEHAEYVLRNAGLR